MQNQAATCEILPPIGTAGHGAVCRVRVGKTHEASPTVHCWWTSYASSTDPSLKIRKEMHNKLEWNTNTYTQNLHHPIMFPTIIQSSKDELLWIWHFQPGLLPPFCICWAACVSTMSWSSSPCAWRHHPILHPVSAQSWKVRESMTVWYRVFLESQ